MAAREPLRKRTFDRRRVCLWQFTAIDGEYFDLGGPTPRSSPSLRWRLGLDGLGLGGGSTTQYRHRRLLSVIRGQPRAVESSRRQPRAVDHSNRGIGNRRTADSRMEAADFHTKSDEKKCSLANSANSIDR